MPKKTRPTYSDDDKQKILELARGGRSLASLQREYGVNATTIRTWLRAGEGERSNGGKGDERGHELARLKAENRQLREENTRLRRLAAFYLKEPEKIDTGLAPTFS